MLSVHMIHCNDVEAGVLDDLTRCLQTNIQVSDVAISQSDAVILESNAVQYGPMR